MHRTSSRSARNARNWTGSPSLPSGQAFDRYVRPAPTEAAREEYLASERELRGRIEYCLTVLQEEGSLAPGDNSRRARFLITVTNGLSVARAFPAEMSLLQTEVEVLRAAAEYVLNERPPSDVRSPGPRWSEVRVVREASEPRAREPGVAYLIERRAGRAEGEVDERRRQDAERGGKGHG